MPAYNFYCEKCKKNFSVIISISDYEKKKGYSTKQMAAKLRRLADCLESGEQFRGYHYFVEVQRTH